MFKDEYIFLRNQIRHEIVNNPCDVASRFRVDYNRKPPAQMVIEIDYLSDEIDVFEVIANRAKYLEMVEEVLGEVIQDMLHADTYESEECLYTLGEIKHTFGTLGMFDLKEMGIEHVETLLNIRVMLDAEEFVCPLCGIPNVSDPLVRIYDFGNIQEGVKLYYCPRCADYDNDVCEYHTEFDDSATSIYISPYSVMNQDEVINAWNAVI